MIRLRITACLVFLLMPVRAFAGAGPTTLGLDYRVDEPGCPREGEFREFLAARLGADPFDATATRVLSVTSDSTDPRALEIRVTLVNSEGGAGPSKVLRGPPQQCTEILQRAALAVALALETSPASSPSPSPSPLPVPQPDARDAADEGYERPAREREPEARPHVAPPNTRASSVAASVAAHTGGGALHPGLFLEVTYSYRIGRASFGAGTRAVLPTSEVFAEGAVSTASIGAGPFACIGDGRMGLCAPVTIGALFGSGGNVDRARSDVSPYLTLGLRPEVEVLTGEHLGLRLFAEGYVAPLITAFTFRAGSAWTSSPVGALLGLSGRLLLP